jgi:hypothetical protein
MSSSVRAGLSLMASAAFLCGCQRLNHEQTIALDEGEIRSVEIDAPTRDQTVTVRVTAGSPVDVFIVLEREEEATKEALSLQKPPNTQLAGKLKVQDATLEAAIPAKNRFAVLLSGARTKTDVKLRITGR